MSDIPYNLHQFNEVDNNQKLTNNNQLNLIDAPNTQNNIPFGNQPYIVPQMNNQINNQRNLEYTPNTQNNIPFGNQTFIVPQMNSQASNTKNPNSLGIAPRAGFMNCSCINCLYSRCCRDCGTNTNCCCNGIDCCRINCNFLNCLNCGGCYRFICPCIVCVFMLFFILGLILSNYEYHDDFNEG